MSACSGWPARQERRGGGAHRRQIAEVDGKGLEIERGRSVRLRPQRGGGRFASFRRPASEQDARAALGEHAGGDAPDAAGRAGDDEGASRQIACRHPGLR